MQEFVGKNIYINNPAVESDPYFGTNDVSAAQLIQKTITGFLILKDTVVIKTEDKEYDIKNINMFMHINNLLNDSNKKDQELLMKLFVIEFKSQEIGQNVCFKEGECDWIK